jgi:hypothetical protein
VFKLLLCLFIAHKLEKSEERVVVYEGIIMCTKHPGNGLLLWSDGSMLCHTCGMDKYRKGV